MFSNPWRAFYGNRARSLMGAVPASNEAAGGSLWRSAITVWSKASPPRAFPDLRSWSRWLNKELVHGIIPK